MKLLKLITITLLSLSLSACWNYREIDSFFIVSGFAFDYDFELEKYIFTFEIATPESSGNEAGIKSEVLSSEGSTVYEVVHNAGKVASKPLYWGHAEVCILGRTLAEMNILPILDWLIRETEVRETIIMYISVCETAREIFDQTIPVSVSVAYGIHEMTKADSELSIAPMTHIYELFDMLSSETTSAFIPAIDKSSECGIESIAIVGSAMIYDGKLVGFLNENDTRNLLMIRNEAKNGTISIKNSNHPDCGEIGFLIEKCSSKISPVSGIDDITFNIKLYIDLRIGGQYKYNNMMESENTKELEGMLAEYIRGNLYNLIYILQKQYGVDVTGFSSVLKLKRPAVWKSIEPAWNEAFKNAGINIDVKVKIINTGQYQKGI